MGLFKRLFGHGDDPGFADLASAAMTYLQTTTTSHHQLWGLGTEARWDIDQDDGRLVFQFPDRGTIVRCPAQIIGSFDTTDETWLWSWANPSVVKSLTRDAAKVRTYGEEYHYKKLTTAKWRGSEDDAWSMAAIACKLCSAQGAYRGPAGSTHIFMTFGTCTISPASP